MKQQTIYLLRHGEIELPRPRCLIGQMNLPLSLRGVEQAETWRNVFRSIPFDCIYCSDLDRTCRTAQIIARDNRTNIIEMSQLREINLGMWDGLTADEIEIRFPGQWRLRGEDSAGFRPEGGESFADLYDRVIPAFESIVKSNLESILIITHAGVIRVVLAHILGMPLSNIFKVNIDYSCAVILAVKQNSSSIQSINIRPQEICI